MPTKTLMNSYGKNSLHGQNDVDGKIAKFMIYNTNVGESLVKLLSKPYKVHKHFVSLYLTLGNLR